MPVSHQTAAIERFRHLHQAGCFVMPNPWDVGSARLLASLGFPALASTSAGLAWSLGCRDGRVTLDDTLAHFRALSGAVEVPVNGDFLGGFGVAPDAVATNVARAVETGVAGLSVEDATGDVEAPLHDFTLAVERVAAARGAIDASGVPVVLTARSEGFIVGRPDLDETISRLAAFRAAGADCVYAPGLSTSQQITALVQAVAPCPVNVLVGSPSTTVAELAGLGVRRISVGGALARTAWGSILRAAEELATHGTFGGFARAEPFAELERRFD